MTYTLGRYVVREGLRPDNPAFPVYLVYKRDKLIGKSFSRPDLGVCQWLERQLVQVAEQPAEQTKFSMRAWSMKRRGGPTPA